MVYLAEFDPPKCALDIAQVFAVEHRGMPCLRLFNAITRRVREGGVVIA
jgi:hypothetical protein